MATTNFNYGNPAFGSRDDTIYFLQDATADGASPSYSFMFPMGRATLKFWGTWNGASLVFQTGVPILESGDVGYFVPILNPSTGSTYTFTSDGNVTLEHMVKGDLIRCVITNAGASTSLSVTAQAV